MILQPPRTPRAECDTGLRFGEAVPQSVIGDTALTSGCATVDVDDHVVVVGGRHTGAVGVLIRAAAPHQRHHVVRLACGSQARISMAFVHREDCPLFVL